MQAIKDQLYGYCNSYADSRIAAIEQTIEGIREAAANETKSSAGDKYETGREMMQQEIDMNRARLAELYAQKQVLERIDAALISNTVAPGSLVVTTNGNYYLSISAGTITIEGTKYYAVSAASPIGKALAGKRAGAMFSFGGKEICITGVY